MVIKLALTGLSCNDYSILRLSRSCFHVGPYIKPECQQLSEAYPRTVVDAWA